MNFLWNEEQNVSDAELTLFVPTYNFALHCLSCFEDSSLIHINHLNSP
jgi:hypothetical protein